MKEIAYIHENDDFPEILKEVPFFEAFSKENLNHILSASAIIECNPNDVIIKEGDIATRIFILLSGSISVIKKGSVLLNMDKTGDIFGELAAFEREVRSATVIASSNVVCLAIDQKFLEHNLPKSSYPNFYSELYEFIAKITTIRLKSMSELLTQNN